MDPEIQKRRLELVKQFQKWLNKLEAIDVLNTEVAEWSAEEGEIRNEMQLLLRELAELQGRY